MRAKSTRRRKSQKIQRREPRQSRARATVDAVLEATARIVRREGLAGVNTNRIAEVTGISVGTLYGYFPDKTAILVALARRVLQEDRAVLLAALDADAAGDPVRSLVRALLLRHRTDTSLRRAVMSVHLGEGHGNEHSEQTEQFVAELARRGDRLFTRASPPDRLRLFVATRAALGIARATAEETRAQQFRVAALEDEILKLVSTYLAA